MKICKGFFGGDVTEWLSPLKSFIKGEPYYHMWYMYMLIMVYVLIPVIIRVKNDIGEKKFAIVSGVFFLLAVLSGWTMGEVKLKWSIGYAFCFSGYLMMGYIIRIWANKHKNNVHGILCIISGLAIEMVIVYLRYQQAMNGILDSELEYPLVKPLTPIVAISSLLIFMGFSMLKIHCNLGNLPKMSFYIYLFHAGVLGVINEGIELIGKTDWNIAFFIPVCSLATFLISYILSIAYNGLWNKVVKVNE